MQTDCPLGVVPARPAYFTPAYIPASLLYTGLQSGCLSRQCQRVWVAARNACLPSLPPPPAPGHAGVESPCLPTM